MLSGTVQALGLPPLAVWLLLWTNLIAPARSDDRGAATGVGALLFVLGAINVAVASSVRGVFYAQWIAQLGLLSLGLGCCEFTPALAHLLVASLLLSLVLGWLAEASQTGTHRRPCRLSAANAPSCAGIRAGGCIDQRSAADPGL